MWYSLDDDGLIQFTTFTKSQKIINLQRDPHISCMLEEGKAYAELRGLVVEGTAELIIGDADATLAVMRRSPEKYPSNPSSRQSDADVRRVAAKRCIVKVHPDKIYSWGPQQARRCLLAGLRTVMRAAAKQRIRPS